MRLVVLWGYILTMFGTLAAVVLCLIRARLLTGTIARVARITFSFGLVAWAVCFAYFELGILLNLIADRDSYLPDATGLNSEDRAVLRLILLQTAACLFVSATCIVLERLLRWRNAT
jgi:hypothetical protein